MPAPSPEIDGNPCGVLEGGSRLTALAVALVATAIAGTATGVAILLGGQRVATWLAACSIFAMFSVRVHESCHKVALRVRGHRAYICWKNKCVWCPAPIPKRDFELDLAAPLLFAIVPAALGVATQSAPAAIAILVAVAAAGPIPSWNDISWGAAIRVCPKGTTLLPTKERRAYIFPPPSRDPGTPGCPRWAECPHRRRLGERQASTQKEAEAENEKP